MAVIVRGVRVVGSYAKDPARPWRRATQEEWAIATVARLAEHSRRVMESATWRDHPFFRVLAQRQKAAATR